jgi:ABC-type bacteriocin/lantibiotic exporter with double-glycine peptidase domain
MKPTLTEDILRLGWLSKLIVLAWVFFGARSLFSGHPYIGAIELMLGFVFFINALQSQHIQDLYRIINGMFDQLDQISKNVIPSKEITDALQRGLEDKKDKEP